jgi:hypothetical protein
MLDIYLRGADKTVLRRTVLNRDVGQLTSAPWEIEMKSISIEEPEHLVRTLTRAIIGSGGCVVSRGSNHTGVVSMAFEFERQNCTDIYCALVGVGLELSQSAHTRLTELCQCTSSLRESCGSDIAIIDLEIQTFPAKG